MQKRYNSHFKILATQRSKCQLRPERIRNGVTDYSFAVYLKTFSSAMCSVLSKVIICQFVFMGYVASNCRVTVGDEHKNTWQESTKMVTSKLHIQSNSVMRS